MKHLAESKSIEELQNLDGKVAIISGGAGFLGSMMASALAEMGSNIAIVDRNKEEGERVCSYLGEKYSCDTSFFELDLSDDEEVSKIPKLVNDRFGGLDILINAAAIVIDKYIEGWAVDFEDQKSSLWVDAIQVNLTSAFTLSRESYKYLKISGKGNIVNIISHYGIVGPDWSLYKGTEMGNAAAYASSKGGLLQLTKWLATTLAPEVRVNSITPGGIYRKHKDPFLSRYKAKTPMKRMGSEEDFKGAVLFLTSDLSSYVTGHNLVIDGGITII